MQSAPPGHRSYLTSTRSQRSQRASRSSAPGQTEPGRTWPIASIGRVRTWKADAPPSASLYAVSMQVSISGIYQPSFAMLQMTKFDLFLRHVSTSCFCISRLLTRHPYYDRFAPRRICGIVRLAGFRLIEAGLEQKPTPESPCCLPFPCQSLVLMPMIFIIPGQLSFTCFTSPAKPEQFFQVRCSA